MGELQDNPKYNFTPPVINVTKDYNKFKLMRGNRVVDQNHVLKLKNEMKANPDLLTVNPILVNEHGFIIDGQHRHRAAQELNVPLYYIKMPGATLDETRHLNVTQKAWGILDFANSYADSGREDYKVFINFHKKYPRVSLSILRIYLAGAQKNGIEADFRRGDFQVSDAESAKHNLDFLDAVIEKSNMQVNTPMAMALLQLRSRNKEFDPGLFLQKLDKDGARELFQLSNAVRGCLRSVENVYNFGSKWQKRLY